MAQPQQQPPPKAPSPLWRAGSTLTMGLTGAVSWIFLRTANKLEVFGLEHFTKLLDEREDVQGRSRGLITVANHTSVLDDPLMWGSLPWRYMFTPDNLRWSMGSHDIMFKNKILESFFASGQTLPTHRLQHSRFGGLFQPTVAQAVKLLSSRPFTVPQRASADRSVIQDPFTEGEFTYTTTGTDVVLSPSAYESRRFAWVHIFPEGKIHQHKDRIMRYFKWGVSRLILESEPCPDLVPIWIEGFDEVMHEARSWPRPVPRIGKKIMVLFGDKVDMEATFGDLRRKWKDMFEQARLQDGGQKEYKLGEMPESLREGEAAVKLREECTMRVREEVLKLRRQRGWEDEDPKCRLVDTWRSEGKTTQGEGQLPDGSWVKDM